MKITKQRGEAGIGILIFIVVILTVLYIWYSDRGYDQCMSDPQNADLHRLERQAACHEIWKDS